MKSFSYKKNIAGPNSKSPYIHRNSIDMSGMSVGDKVILHHVYSLPVNVGGDDWYKEGTGLVLHSKGAQDPR